MKNRGVTLIALVITIIILLILAGITINALTGENGLFGRAKEAGIKHESAEELEVVGLFVADKFIDSAIEEINLAELLGTKLTNRKIVGVNQLEWKIITEINEGELSRVYASGWYYIEAGTQLPDGKKLKYGYIVNYSTGEVVRYDANNHAFLEDGIGLAVTRGLIFNLDPSNMGDNPLTWGGAESIGTLHNFASSGITQTSIKFDGVDDYISIARQTSYDFTNGFTIEVYGKLVEDYPIHLHTTTGPRLFTFTMPLFSIGNVSGGSGYDLRFSLRSTQSTSKSLRMFNSFWGAMGSLDSESSWKETNHTLNYIDNVKYIGSFDEPFYISITFDPDTLTLSLYKQGILQGSTQVSQAYWDESITRNLTGAKPILIRCEH